MSLHPLLLEGLELFIKETPLEKIRELAVSMPAFTEGGFRAVKPDKLRARATQVLARCLAEPVEKREALFNELKPGRFSLVETFSEFLISSRADALAALMGAAPFAFACWIDLRKNVRELVETRLGRKIPFDAMTAAEAAQHLRDGMDAGQFARLFSALGANPENAPPMPAPADTGRDDIRKLREEIARLHEENRRLKGAEDRAARQRERADKAADALADTLRAQRELEADTRRLTREREELREELARETKHRDTRLLALHEAEMAEAFEGWLGRAREVELESQKDADVLARAEAALKNQADSERHSGNRAVLLARREAVEKTRGRVADALANAIRPTAALLAAARDLQDEAQRLDALLETQNLPATPFENAVALHAHKAGEDDLFHLSTLLDRMEEFAALEPAALRRLRATLDKRRAFLHATAGDPANVKASSEPVAILRRALMGEKGAFLIIDGHNVFFALQGKYAAASGPVVPDREKRARFVADAVRVARSRPTCRVWIVFDGPVYNEETPAPNVRVIYSGGVGDHRADKIVADTARFLRHAEPGVPLIVATNDNALSGEIRKTGALHITGAELGSFL